MINKITFYDLIQKDTRENHPILRIELSTISPGLSIYAIGNMIHPTDMPTLSWEEIKQLEALLRQLREENDPSLFKAE